MSEKRPLQAMEEMVHKLPPVNKKRKKRDKDSTTFNIECGARTGSRQPIRRSHHHGSPDNTPSTHTVHNRGQKSQFECLPLPRMQSNIVWSLEQWKGLRQMSSESMPHLHAFRLCLQIHEQRLWQTTRKLSKTKEDLDMRLRRRGFAQSEQNRKKIQVAPTLYVEKRLSILSVGRCRIIQEK